MAKLSIAPWVTGLAVFTTTGLASGLGGGCAKTSAQREQALRKKQRTSAAWVADKFWEAMLRRQDQQQRQSILTPKRCRAAQLRGAPLERCCKTAADLDKWLRSRQAQGRLPQLYVAYLEPWREAQTGPEAKWKRVEVGRRDASSQAMHSADYRARLYLWWLGGRAWVARVRYLALFSRESSPE